MRVFFVAAALVCLPGCSSRRYSYTPRYRSPAEKELNRRINSINAIKYQLVHGPEEMYFFDDKDLDHDDMHANNVEHGCGIQMTGIYDE